MSVSSPSFSAGGPALYKGLFSPRAWTVIAVLAAILGVVVPVLHLVPSESSAFFLSAFWVGLLGKFMCYAVLALAMDMIWGYTGILSLGQGLWFALGGYAFGMYLMRQIGHDGVYQSDLPDFMVFLDWKAFPWYWKLTDHFLWSMLWIVAAPGLLAFVFGFFAFRSRIKGVYFSIITQALTFAAMLAFFRNDMGFGGNNGFTDFKRVLGISITSPATRTVIYLLSVLYLLASLILCRAIVRSKLGRVLTAIRDSESRLLFMGYRTLWFKLFVWTLAAVMSGIAGALYVPQVGIINPSEMSPANSIEIAIWTAVGGRGTLFGPILGAFVVNGAKSWFTVTFPQYWLYFLGLLFVLVTLLLPRGLIGLPAMLRKRGRGTAAALNAASDAAEGGASVAVVGELAEPNAAVVAAPRDLLPPDETNDPRLPQPSPTR
jgi:urea transport system permease protein